VNPASLQRNAEYTNPEASVTVEATASPEPRLFPRPPTNDAHSVLRKVDAMFIQEDKKIILTKLTRLSCKNRIINLFF
jgi:hypothetical protein